MSSPNLKLQEVPIKDIGIGERRTAAPERVQWLTESIRDIGLQHPIGLTENLQLIHGLHRIEAYKTLRRKKIPAFIHDVDELKAEMAEIDENLLRHELDALELGEALVRRKEIYEQLHPETKHGGDRKSQTAKSSGNNCHLIAFAQDAAEKMGKSARTVRLYMKAAVRIHHDLRKQLRNTDVGKKIKELDKLGSLPEADQRAVVERIVDGAPSVADAIKTIKGPRSPEMQKIVRAKLSTCGSVAKRDLPEEGRGRGSDTGDKASEVHQPGEMPSKEACAAVDTPAEQNVDAETAAEVETDLATETLASGDQTPAEGPPDAEDPVAAYRDLLQELPKKIGFLCEHCQGVVGKALDSNEAAEVLQQAIQCLGALREMELDRAEQSAEADPATSAA